MHERDERAERAILSSAEAYRLVQEARDQRERAEQAEAKLKIGTAALEYIARNERRGPTPATIARDALTQMTIQ